MGNIRFDERSGSTGDWQHKMKEDACEFVGKKKLPCLLCEETNDTYNSLTTRW